MELTTLLIAGAVAGTTAGLFGIGGGLIIVPVLNALFLQAGYSPNHVIKLAIGTSLAAIVFTSASSLWAHHRRRGVRWPLVATMAPGVVIGSLLGAAVADWMPAFWLGVVFTVFIVLIAVRIGWGTTPMGNTLPAAWQLSALSGGAGSLSALLGIGGGVMHVPLLTWGGVPIREAIGTAAAVGFPLAVTSALAFMVMGSNEQPLPAHSLGYVHLPALGAIVVTSMVFAPLGAKLAHRIPERLLKRSFAGFVLLLAGQMAFTLFNT